MKTISDVDKFMAIKDPEDSGIVWYDARNSQLFNLCGTKGDDFNRFTNQQFEELKSLEDVCFLAHHSSGLQLKFKTNSLKIFIEVDLIAPHDMDHMPATGQCGFDIYCYDEEVKKYVLHNTTRFKRHLTHYKSALSVFHYFTDVDKMRSYIINFPLYQGVKSVKIGLCDGATTIPEYYGKNGLIVHYGTSIAQGGCVSRPGMMYTNMLSRTLDTEFLNFGFSGCAMCEASLGEALGKIENQKLFIIDAEANAGCTDIMEKRLEEFINAYKLNSPNVPIILVTRCKFNFDHFDEHRIKLNKFYIDFTKALVQKYRSLGHKMYFLDGSDYFSNQELDYSEFTVDGVHPTDFGTYLIYKSYLKKIKEVLE